MCEFVFFDSELSIKQLPVCRTDKIPLGTKGRTSILSVESSTSCGASFPVSRRKLLDRACFVTSFRQGGYTPLRRLCGYPLWTCRPQTVLTNRLPPASLKIRHKQILRMVYAIRRINCFTDTRLCRGLVFRQTYAQLCQAFSTVSRPPLIRYNKFRKLKSS